MGDDAMAVEKIQVLALTSQEPARRRFEVDLGSQDVLIARLGRFQGSSWFRADPGLDLEIRSELATAAFWDSVLWQRTGFERRATAQAGNASGA